ncbi:guanylate kinase [Gammaproteobacteria bacterium]|nr:guanylate kinase [Gammaproteobacteria bacterium]
MHKIVIVTGPSGVGKTVLSEYLLTATNFHRCITCTTRLPRASEQNGVDYFFLTPDEFKQTRDAGGFVEYSQHYQAEYGIRAVDLEVVLEKNHVLLVLDCGGAKYVATKYPTQTVFIAPPSTKELEGRLIKRSGSASERLLYAEEELTQMNDFNYVLVNKELEDAKQELLKWANEVIDSR